MTQHKLLLTGAMLTLLVGCTTTNVRQGPVVVEEKGIGATQSKPGSVVVVEPARSDNVVIDLPPQQANTTTPINKAEPVQSTGGQWAKVERQPAQTYTPSPAVAGLLRTAQAQANRGEMGAAQATLDRAQRIAPSEPQVYLQMAQLRVRADKWSEAEQLALKGVQVGQGSAPVLNKLWLLIAEARDQTGDRAGAQRATIRARRYQ